MDLHISVDALGITYSRCKLPQECMNKFHRCKTEQDRCCTARWMSEVGRRESWGREKGCCMLLWERQLTGTRPVGRERPGEELRTKVESSCFLLRISVMFRAELSCSEPLPWYLAAFSPA